MNILLIEDDKVKIERLSNFLKDEDLTIKESYHSGLKEIVSNNDFYDLLLLDMTIPLWDKNSSDFGGTYEQFGGDRILREMDRRNKKIPTILVTMFDVFSLSEDNLTFGELNQDLKHKFSEFYLGAVFYNASDDSWKLELTNLMKTTE
jgi:CheY-like chemotaxis protein